MSRFRSLSSWFRRLSRRERRVVVAGASVSAAVLAVVFVVLPATASWSDRQQSIDAKREQLARLEQLIAREAEVGRLTQSQRTARGQLSERLVTGATSDVAASNLQELVQRYAAESSVELDRFDVARSANERGDPADDESSSADASAPATARSSAVDPLDQLENLRVRISAEGDIYGFVSMLHRLQHGEKLLVIDQLRVSARSPADDGREIIRWSLHVRAPIITD